MNGAFLTFSVVDCSVYCSVPIGDPELPLTARDVTHLSVSDRNV